MGVLDTAAGVPTVLFVSICTLTIVVSWAQVAVKLSYRAGYTGRASPESSYPQLYSLPGPDA